MRMSFLTEDVPEPYRIWFPLGWLAGLLGVALWPLHEFAGLAYPGPVHMRLLAVGFFLPHILGFLGTAGPRIIEVRPLDRGLTWMVTALLGTAIIAYAAGRLSTGDLAAWLAMSVCAAAALRRFPARRDLPPPGFVFAIAGFVGGWLGLALLGLLQLRADLFAAPMLWHAVAGILVNQLLPLLPVIGVAPFFLPKLDGSLPRHGYAGGPAPTAAWLRPAIGAALGVLVIWATVGLEAMGWIVLAQVLRLAVFVLWLGFALAWKPVRGAGDLAWLGWSALYLILLAQVLWVITPGHGLAWKHVLLIGGGQGMIMAVATRVIYGHSGEGHLSFGKMPHMRLVMLFWALALLTRLSAEWLPAVRSTHLAYAAVLWLGALGLWIAPLLPRLRQV